MSQPEAALNKAYSLAKSAAVAVANGDFSKAASKHKEAAVQLLQSKKLSTDASVQRSIDALYAHHVGEAAKLEGMESSRIARIARIDEEAEETEHAETALEPHQPQQQQQTRSDLDFGQIIDRFVNLSISMNNQGEFEGVSETDDPQQTIRGLKVHIKALERNAQMRSTSLQNLGTKMHSELTEHHETATADLRAENARLRAENEKLTVQMAKMKSKWDSLVQNALNKRKERQ